MTAPIDLSKLRINRDAPSAPVRKALRRNAIMFGVAVVVIAAVGIRPESRAVPVVQVVTAAATTGAGTATAGAT